MLTTIFKFISIIGLIVVLSMIIEKRDILPFVRERLISPTIMSVRGELGGETSYLKATPENSVPNNTVQQPNPLPDKINTAEEGLSLPKKIIITPSIAYEPMHEPISDTDESYRPAVSPCKVAMGYHIGVFDSRFGISKEQFRQEIKQSSELWSDAKDKTLFFYDESGPLTINLIYDSRQATTERVNLLALEIDNTKSSADILRKSYEQEKELYDRDSDALKIDSEDFVMRQEAYAQKVRTYNASGGASRVEYDAMTLELNNLKQEAATLDARRDAIIIFMNSINNKVARYNELVIYVNGLIRQSNALGASKFTEGRFIPSSNTIDIFQYNDSVKLRRVLAHEFGHVLGINHNKNMSSIMYTFNIGTSTTLSKEDLSSLNEVCLK